MVESSEAERPKGKAGLAAPAGGSLPEADGAG